MTTGLEGPDYLQYKKDHEIVKSNEFTDWILSLKPEDVGVRKYLEEILEISNKKLRMARD